MIRTQTLKKKKIILFLSHLTQFSSLYVRATFTHLLILLPFHSLPLTVTLSCSPCGHLATLPFLQLAKPNLRCRISLSIDQRDMGLLGGFLFFFFFGIGFKQGFQTRTGPYSLTRITGNLSLTRFF